MVNLLTQETRAQLLAQYKKRVIAVALLALSVVLIVATLILLPFAVRYRDTHELYAVEIARIEEYLATTDAASRKDEALAVVDVLEGAREVVRARPLSFVLERAVLAAPSSVDVLSMSLDQEGVIELVGEADNRQAIVDYADALKKTEGVAHVDVPITNFIDGVDAAFRITFYLEPHE